MVFMVRHHLIFPQRFISPAEYWNFDETALLTGEGKIFQLIHHWFIGFISKGYTLHVVDCAMRFDTYKIAEECFRNGISPEKIADKILIQRAFTPYQILDTTKEIFSSTHNNTLYFYLAPAKQFFDGDVKDIEGFFLLEKLYQFFSKFKQLNIPLLIVEKSQYRHHAFINFYRQLNELACPVWNFSSTKVAKKVYYQLDIKKSDEKNSKGVSDGS